MIIGRDGSAVLPAPTSMPAVAHVERPTSEALTFEGIYDTHFAFVWRLLRTFGVPETALEDAAQDAFVVVHRRLGEFEGRAAITTWLFAIARRVACGYRRKVGRDARSEPIGDADFVATTDTFAAMSRAQATTTVLVILDTMDEDKRAVFALVELEQLSVPEVAKLLDLNLNTTYSRLRSARQHFEARVRTRLMPPEGEP